MMKSVVRIIAFFAMITLLFTGCRKKEYSLTVTGMGTVISLSLESSESEQKLLELFEEIESSCSRTVADSALNTLNDSGTVEDKYISEQVLLAQDVMEKSNGALDITVGALADLWHFSEARVPEESEIALALMGVGSENVEVNGQKVTVNEKTVVDLGAVTKGYALDKAKEILKEQGAKYATVAVGGSVLFYGSKGKKWVCGVRDPFDSSKLLGSFKLSEGCVSTSGSYERYFEKDDKRYHHILDSKTGYPVQNGLVSVTVVCENGFLSDALSTACFVLGKENGIALLQEYGCKGIFVEENGEITVVGDIGFEKA